MAASQKIYRHSRWFWLLAGVALAVSCARQAAPQGGPRDEDPPVLLRSEPPAQSTHFTESSVKLYFDEFIVLDNIREKFVISPPLDEKPEVTPKGKWVDIDLGKDLRDSTTYTLVFGDAIRDNNEGNEIPYFEFVFSTYSHIDSAYVEGHIYRADNLEAEQEGVFILAHPAGNDTAFRTSIPLYVGRPTAEGAFLINNMKPGSYDLYALKDANNNLLFDLPNESIAFLNESVHAGTGRPQLQEDSTLLYKDEHHHYHLYLFEEESKNRFLSASDRPAAWKVELVFSRPQNMDSVEITPFEPFTSEDILQEINPAGDSLILWITDTAFYHQENVQLLLGYLKTDSLDRDVYTHDTLDLRFTKPRTRKKEAEAEADTLLPLLLNVQNGRTFDFFKNIQLESETPLQQYRSENLTFRQVNDSVFTDVNFSLKEDTVYPRKRILEVKLEEETKYRLEILPGAFTDIYGRSNDSVLVEFKTSVRDKYANLLLNLQAVDTTFVIQVLTEKEDVVAEAQVEKAGVHRFDYLRPGKYRLRAIRDENGDGKWTPGEYAIGKQPEAVTYYPDVLELKANWDLEQAWDLSRLYLKSKALRGEQKK